MTETELQQVKETIFEAVNKALEPILRSRSEQLLTIDETAAYFHVSRQTIHTWIREGRLERIKAGRSSRISAAEIERKTAEGKLGRYAR